MVSDSPRPALTSERLQSLEEQVAMQCIIGNAPDPVLYTLTFHSAFAVKIFEVIRREGRGIQGFDRMQQSLRESVEQVRSSISSLPGKCQLERFLGPSADAQSALMRLVRDLARYKNWMLGEPEHPNDLTN